VEHEAREESFVEYLFYCEKSFLRRNLEHEILWQRESGSSRQAKDKADHALTLQLSSLGLILASSPSMCVDLLTNVCVFAAKSAKK